MSVGACEQAWWVFAFFNIQSAQLPMADFCRFQQEYTAVTTVQWDKENHWCYTHQRCRLDRYLPRHNSIGYANERSARVITRSFYTALSVRRSIDSLLNETRYQTYQQIISLETKKRHQLINNNAPRMQTKGVDVYSDRGFSAKRVTMWFSSLDITLTGELVPYSNSADIKEMPIIFKSPCTYLA